MNTLLTILFVIAGFVGLVMLIALFMRKNYHIEREIIINAPAQKVFDYLKHLKNQDNFNKWVMVEPEMKREFRGTDGTVGFVYAWSGKKAGEGEQEIKNITEGKTIETEIRFVRPMPGVARANLITEQLTDKQTKVKWSNESAVKYPMNVMTPMLEKMLGRDMDTSLQNLKNILEK